MIDKNIKSSENFLRDFDRVAQTRQEVAGYLFGMMETISAAEHDAPAKLELQQTIDQLDKNAQNLKEGVFRLLVLGDMKRGKSTFLNALLGDIVLPADVNPCTAILTKLRYGAQSGVTVYFKDEKSPEKMSLNDFRETYTIKQEEASRFEKENKLAFPDVSHAEIEYPLPLLEKGVEIIDSPGLNDTEQRNEMSLGYILESHAVLFVMSATQLFTLGEERYLQNYMHGRGLTVFFLINMWDEIANKLLDPTELTKKEEEIRGRFREKLTSNNIFDNKNLYNQRVFEISALDALKARLNREGYSLETSGFQAFIDALTRFLTHDRALAEMQLARLTARNSAATVREKVEQQISMLDLSTTELKERIAETKPKFDDLTTISNDFNGKIKEIRDSTSDRIAQSFKEYFLRISETFEVDFVRYMPEISAFELLKKGKREEFQNVMESEFDHYMNDKIADWSRSAEVELQTAFLQLSQQAAQYAVSYNDVTNRITATLTEKNGDSKTEKTPLLEESPLWQRLVAGGLAVAGGDLAGGVMAGAGIFNWKTIFKNLGIVLGASALLYATVGAVLTPLGASLLGLVLGGWQWRQARQKFIDGAKEELSKKLPAMTEQGSEKIYRSVHQQFTDYGLEVQKLLNEDMSSRQKQMDNLLAEREAHEMDIERETNRLQKLVREVDSAREKVELAFDRLIGGEQHTNSRIDKSSQVLETI